MSLRINDIAPDFVAETTRGRISFHEWIGDGYAVLFSHPKDFTPVCTTELGHLAAIAGEFRRRGVRIIGVSVDPVASHVQWQRDIEKVSGHVVDYPLIGDKDLNVAKRYGMLPAIAGCSSSGRTAADNATVRSVFVIGPDKKIKLTMAYPMTTGRNFDELLRAIDAIQLTARHGLATPAQWEPGGDLIVPPGIDDDQAREKFGAFERLLPYLRTVRQPSS